MTANLLRLGVGSTMTRSIGALEIAGALGLMAGLWFKPLAVAAAAGLTLLLIGAVGFHLRARDFAHRRHRSHAVAPVVLAVVTGTTMALLLATFLAKSGDSTASSLGPYGTTRRRPRSGRPPPVGTLAGAAGLNA